MHFWRTLLFIFAKDQQLLMCCIFFLYLVQYAKEQIYPTLFTKRVEGKLFICQLYVDDIIFGLFTKAFNDVFAKLITEKFEIPMMKELEYLLGFEVNQPAKGTFINQAK